MVTFVHDSVADTEEESPGFLFVVCDEQNGRAPKQSKAIRKRHVMRTYKASLRDKTQAAEDKHVEKSRRPAGLVSCLAPVRSKTSGTPYQPTSTARICSTQATDVILSAPVPASPYESVHDVPSVCRWYFYEEKADGTQGFDVARHHFMEMQWHLAKEHEV